MVCSGRGEGTLKPEKTDGRRDAELARGILDGVMSVTNLENEAIARKQNLAGVVKENKTGRMWGASIKGV